MTAIPERRSDESTVDRRYRIAAIALVLLGAARIAATYPQLSETVDEVAHIGAGMEWLARGQYTFELQHPPLARIAAAAGPYLLGIRSQDQVNLWNEGREVLYEDDAYLRNLTAARLGILPFFFVAAFFIWRFARTAFGPAEAVGAVACFTLLPPILAHFGLATTDAPLFALFGAAVHAGAAWLRTPNVAHGVALGVSGALAAVTKFSAIPYLGLTAVLAGLARWWASRRREGAPQPGATNDESRWRWNRAVVSMAAGGAAAFIAAWAVYRFTLDPVGGVPLPLIEVPKGLLEVKRHNELGHPAYFLGESRSHGVWYFFPVILALKTPLAALALGLLGFGLLIRRARASRDWIALVPVAAAAAVLGVAMTSAINIGVRHALPFYFGLSLAVGVAWVWLWRRLATRALHVALVAGTAILSIGSATVHPDYLAYFNVLAGRDPSRLVADSDLDWGQDMFRLRREVQARGVDTLRFAYIGTSDLSPIVGVPVKYWNGMGRPVGWVAVAETWYRRGVVLGRREGEYIIDQHRMRWLDSAATATRVGNGIRLYRIPPTAGVSPVR